MTRQRSRIPNRILVGNFSFYYRQIISFKYQEMSSGQVLLKLSKYRKKCIALYENTIV